MIKPGWTFCWLLAFTSILNGTPVKIATFIPSSAGGLQGIFTEISYPSAARYGAAGAPVLVHVAGGWGGNTAGQSVDNWEVHDFIEIRYNFPGSGEIGKCSGSTFDKRGLQCALATRDVARFALGLQADVNGKYLHQLTGGIAPAYTNVGLCGWSNGGNLTITIAGAFGAELPGLAWIVNWESPVGDGNPNVECGGKARLNPAYDPDTGEFNMALLAFSDTLTVRDRESGETFHGGLYYDLNGNQIYDFRIDFVVDPIIYLGKGFVSIRAAQAAASANILPGTLPEHMTTPAETEEFWRYRNGEYWFAAAVTANPGLMFIVEAGVEDHVQGAIDHPHVLLQYEGFRQAGARFVRLNPDRAYVETVLGAARPAAVDNDAFQLFDHVSIRTALEPKGPTGVVMSVGVAAAVLEVADRTHYGNLFPQIEPISTRVLHQIGASDYLLEQNYPNPFNTGTRIVFKMKNPGKVNLTVFNIRGQMVARLEESFLPAGRYERVFNASGLPDGIYFYRLRSDSFLRIKKMHLVR